MRGNLHVQFLGGWARATAPGYPATSGLTRAAIRLQMTRDTDRDCSIEGDGGNPPEQQHRMRLYGAGARWLALAPYASILPPSQRQGPLRSGFACP
jgi:hypothetical protein